MVMHLAISFASDLAFLLKIAAAPTANMSAHVYSTIAGLASAGSKIRDYLMENAESIEDSELLEGVVAFMS